MWQLVIKESAVRDLAGLEKTDRERIKKKLEFFCASGEPLKFARRLTSPEIGTYRFRIGDYRAIFDVDEAGRLILIAVIGHRSEVYRVGK